MQVSAANNPISTRPIEQPAPAPSPSEPMAPAQDIVDMRRVAALLTMLENNPEIRPEVVARGRALVSDPGYPPPQIIDKLARLIVSDEP